MDQRADEIRQLRSFFGRAAHYTIAVVYNTQRTGADMSSEDGTDEFLTVVAQQFETPAGHAQTMNNRFNWSSQERN